MEGQFSGAPQKDTPGERPVAPPTKVRMVFSVIVFIVGLVLLGNDQQGWGWGVTALGVVSIIYNLSMMRKGK